MAWGTVTRTRSSRTPWAQANELARSKPRRAPMNAAALLKALEVVATEEQKPKTARFFFDGLGPTQVLGIQIGAIFPIAKGFRDLPLTEIERLLDSQYYEVRMAGVAIMVFQARQKAPVNPLESLYDLYLRRHDRLDNWDFVDRAAPHVVGQYLNDRPRTPLYELAASSDPWRRRTAIVATWWFIRQGDVEDVYALSEILARDRHPMIEKALGSWLRTAGDVDKPRLRDFLLANHNSLSATTLRMASEKFSPEDKAAIRRKEHRAAEGAK
jgi:3-methyladenine DNA glycosylase AlkD